MESISLTPKDNVFLGINVNSPLSKKYNILPYTQQIIKNENNIFDIIYYKGNKKKFNYIKNIYINEKSKIKNQILTQSKKDKIFKSSKIINIKTFDLDKISVHSPLSLFEGTLISGLIRHLNNKKIAQKKILENNKKNKLVLKRPSLSLKKNITLNNFLNKKQNNFFSEENKIISNNNSYIENNNETLNNDSKINFSSINNLFDNDAMDIKTKNEFQKTINTIFSRPFPTLNKDKNSLSSINFFEIQSKKIKIKGTKDQKMNLKRKKLSKILFSKLFKEENKIVNNLNEINSDLIDFKYSNHSNNSNITDNQTLNMNNNFHTPRNNKYKKMNEILTSFHKNLYKFPIINKFIFGAKKPRTLFNKPKIKTKIDSNLSK